MGVRDRVVLEKQHVTYSYHQLRCLCWKDCLLPLGSKHEGMHTVPLLHPRQDYSLLSFPLSYKPQEVGCPPRHSSTVSPSPCVRHLINILSKPHNPCRVGTITIFFHIVN